MVGLAGPALHPAERDWLLRWQPAGVILFTRNVTDPEACRRLVADLHAVLPARAEILRYIHRRTSPARTTSTQRLWT